jgi:hypothetical protein
VVLRVNTDVCGLTGDLMWRALRNIHCLDLQFKVGPAQQRRMLQQLPAGSIHCDHVSVMDTGINSLE